MTLRSCIASAILIGALAPIALAQESAPVEKGWSKYQPVIRNNIFLRDRAAARASSTARPSTPPEPGVERSTVLTGVVRQDEQFIAFLEDMRSGRTQRVRVGDAVALGRVTAIAFGHIEYDKGESPARIEVGQNLEGGSAGSLPAARAASSTSAAPMTGAAPTTSSATPRPATGSAAETSILERMRQRRMQETQR